jgi:hypothetical protein
MAHQVAVVIFLSLGTISDLKIEFILKKKEMSQSNNHLSMINLLLFLGIALPQVSGYTLPECYNHSTDCCWVVESWKQMGKSASFNPSAPNACCYKLGWTTQTTGIFGVTCDSDGKVTKIDWKNKGLSGFIPGYIEKLTSLTYL